MVKSRKNLGNQLTHLLESGTPQDAKKEALQEKPNQEMTSAFAGLFQTCRH